MARGGLQGHDRVAIFIREMQLKKNDVAEILFQLKCLTLSPSQPFVYASGLRGPIYCDNRQILSFPRERAQIVEGLEKVLEESGWKYDSLAGLATAGIPHAAFLAAKVQSPMLYIRSQAKGHGKQNQVEGRFEKGERVVLIEDLVNQGSSLEQAVKAAKAAGLQVVGCLCIVSYQMEGAIKRLEELEVPLISLTDFDSIVEVALVKGEISQGEAGLLKDWQKNPQAWSKAFD